MQEREFTALVDAYGSRVFNHCLRRTGSFDTAEELAAITFLEAWRKRGSIPDDFPLPWLLGVANNVLRNQRRGYRRYRKALAAMPVPRAESDPDDDLIARIDAERAIARLLPHLARLSAVEREVIELCSGSGLTHTEAAVALGIPVGTVKSRLSRATATLRKALEETSSPTPSRTDISHD